jgi:hypothetical protein
MEERRVESLKRLERIRYIASSNLRINDGTLNELLKYRKEVAIRWCESESLEVREALESLLEYSEGHIKKYLYL